jgi:hypothetical protein
MALIDISLVTTGLMKLLEDNINKNLDSEIDNLSVTAEPPDKVGAVGNRLSLYMYHLAEEPFYKNIQGSDPRNVASSPMGLCLYYVLTAHHDQSTDFDALTQQRLMGYAVKTLHDFPIIHDGTSIDGETILPAALVGRDNPIQVIMRPTAPEDAIAFWGTEDQQTPRLSAYYEVRVVLLEPEEPSMTPAPVLSLGTFLYQLGTPHLERTRSVLPFVLPAIAGGLTQFVEASPARLSGADDDPPCNQLVLVGCNLSIGKRRQVFLRSERWGGAFPVDLELAANAGAGWALSASETELVLTIAPTLTILDAEQLEDEVELRPGVYTAFVRVIVDERLVAGALVPLASDSNEVPWIVIPRIASVAKAGTNRLTVTIVETFALDDPDLDIRLIIAGQPYVEAGLGNPEDPDDAGRFEISSATELTVQALFDTDAPADHAIRLIVNGAESAPFWIELS